MPSRGSKGLLNYTTGVDAVKTVGEIQAMLASKGASHVMVEYGGDRQPAGITFMMQTAAGQRSYRLPAKLEAVERVLGDQWRKGKIPKKFTGREQAARVGWRIVANWVEAQLAIIETEMVSMDEVMLPYMLTGNGTVYEAFRDRQPVLPKP